MRPHHVFQRNSSSLCRHVLTLAAAIALAGCAASGPQPRSRLSRSRWTRPCRRPRRPPRRDTASRRAGSTAAPRRPIRRPRSRGSGSPRTISRPASTARRSWRRRRRCSATRRTRAPTACSPWRSARVELGAVDAAPAAQHPRRRHARRGAGLRPRAARHAGRAGRGARPRAVQATARPVPVTAGRPKPAARSAPAATPPVAAASPVTAAAPVAGTAMAAAARRADRRRPGRAGVRPAVRGAFRRRSVPDARQVGARQSRIDPFTQTRSPHGQERKCAEAAAEGSPAARSAHLRRPDRRRRRAEGDSVRCRRARRLLRPGTAAQAAAQAQGPQVRRHRPRQLRRGDGGHGAARHRSG